MGDVLFTLQVKVSQSAQKKTFFNKDELLESIMLSFMDSMHKYTDLKLV